MANLYITTEAHGGNCCGMFHLFGFPVNAQTVEASLADKVKAIKYAIDEHAKGDDYDSDDEDEGTRAHKSPFCVEVVLSAHQHLSWREALETCGFKAVHTFTNGNTSNELTVFLGDF